MTTVVVEIISAGVVYCGYTIADIRPWFDCIIEWWWRVKWVLWDTTAIGEKTVAITQADAKIIVKSCFMCLRFKISSMGGRRVYVSHHLTVYIISQIQVIKV